MAQRADRPIILPDQCDALGCTTVQMQRLRAIGDLLDELVVNILRYGDRDGGYVLSVGCRDDDMTIALCDTVASGAGAPKESEGRKSGVDEVRTVPGVTTSRHGRFRGWHGRIGNTAGIARTRPADRASWRVDDVGSGRRKLQP